MKRLVWTCSLLLLSGSLILAGNSSSRAEGWDSQEPVWVTENSGDALVSADVQEDSVPSQGFAAETWEEDEFSFSTSPDGNGDGFTPFGTVTDALVSEEEEGEQKIYTSPEEIGLDLREVMKRRETEASFRYEMDGVDASTVTQELIGQIADKIYSTALEETGVSSEGDYLAWHVNSYVYQVAGEGKKDYTAITFSYVLRYNDDAAQEQAFEEKLAQVEQELALDGKTDYDKIRTIFDYIMANVTYDWEEARTGANPVRHSAYSALVEGTAVCQGYATLFYRMLRDSGISVRCISGISKDENHLWNIVQLEGAYYNIDVTWDDPDEKGNSLYAYFLKNDAAFAQDHTRDEQFLTEEFLAAYPVSPVSYDFPATPTPTPTPPAAPLLEQEQTLYSKGMELETTYRFALNITGAEDYTLQYKSSKTKVAKVDKTGLITAKKKGTAVITASVMKNGYVLGFATCKVTVKTPSLKVSALKVKKGKTAALKVKASPKNWVFTFSSSNPKICTVDAQGLVTGVKKGSAKVTVTHGTLKATAKVTVKK